MEGKRDGEPDPRGKDSVSARLHGLPCQARPRRPGAYHPYMRRAFVVTFAVGLLVAAFGLIWALQGFGVISGSPMSNTTTWSVIGPVTVVIGIVIAAFSWRKISSK